MAGDWIKIETALPTKPEVVRIASIMKMHRYEVVGRLVAVWGWADSQSVDGNALSVTFAFLNEIAGVTGFAEAMRDAGWLSGEDGKITFPNFEYHNGKTAKTRAQTAKRVAKLRDGNDDVTQNVTQPPLQKALPEKRREDISSSKGKRRTKINVEGIPEDLLTYLNDIGIGLNNTLADALRESDIALVDAQQLLVECNKDLGRWCREVIDGTWQEVLSGDPAIQVNYRGETPEQERAREKREEEVRLAKKKKEADELAAQRAYEATPEGAAKLAEANAQLAAVKEQLRLRSLQPEVEKPRPPSYHTQFLRLKKDGEEAA